MQGGNLPEHRGLEILSCRGNSHVWDVKARMRSARAYASQSAWSPDHLSSSFNKEPRAKSSAPPASWEGCTSSRTPS